MVRTFADMSCNAMHAPSAGEGVRGVEVRCRNIESTRLRAALKLYNPALFNYEDPVRGKFIKECIGEGEDHTALVMAKVSAEVFVC